MSTTDPHDGAAHFTASGQATQYNAPHGSMTINSIMTPAAVTWPILVGVPPALAAAFQPRQPVLEQIEAARDRVTDVILTHETGRERGAGVLAGGGGVGKTQLAAWLLGQALDQQTADLLLWVTADTPDQIITAYARAAFLAAVPGATGDNPEADAKALLSWLHTTDRRWLIVLDDITDPQHVAGWWPPHRPTGWALATTRLQDATLISAGRRQIDVDIYTPDEAHTYLTHRLTRAGHRGLLDDQATALAAALGYLPLALSHAAAYMIDQQIGCTAYLDRYTTTATIAQVMPATADPDGYGRPVTVTLLLALDAADQGTPAGLARTALALVAVLDPAGHPDALWHTPAVIGYLTRQLRQTRRWWQRWRPTPRVTADQAAQVLRLLHRYGLITHTPARDSASARAVRIHAMTARATRETTADPTVVAKTAADALLHLWPNLDHNTTDLIDALRANTTTLIGNTGDLLWQPDGHPLLYRAGHSLLNAGLHVSAIDYWHNMAADAARIFGDQHPAARSARANLASSYQQAGRTGEAIAIEEQILTDTVRIFGDQHPDTLLARAHLSNSYLHAGRTHEAITLKKRVLSAAVGVLGDQHPDTLLARASLAISYAAAGRPEEAIPLQEQVLADTMQVLGDQHPHTLSARSNLASSYQQVGRINEAIPLQEQVLADRLRVLGDQHLDTLLARTGLAGSYRRAGRINDAITLQEQVLADTVRIVGDQHPHALLARSNLAVSYGQAGRTHEAITLQEQVLADRLRVLGDQHPDTLLARANLAVSYRQAGRTHRAIALLKEVLADSVRVLGKQHPDTLATANALREWQTET